MAKEYWLEWIKEKDAMKGPALPGGYRTLKEARSAAAYYVKAHHPIDIDGSNEIVAKIDNVPYVIVDRYIWGNTRVKMKIRILKDGSLSKAKTGMKDILSDPVLKKILE